MILESPYRALTTPLLRYIVEVENERDDDVVTVVIPEFITNKWWTQLLHGQNGLLLKWALLFHRGVVVTNVRYYVDAQTADVHPVAKVNGNGSGPATPVDAKAEVSG